MDNRLAMPPNPNHHGQAQSAGSNQLSSYSSMFAGAPISKLAAAFTVIAYVSMHTKHNASSVFEFDAARIRERGETFRYITSKMTFSSTGNLVIGTIFLTFLVRKFEWEMGTRKMAFFCSFINLATMASESLIAVNSPSLMSHNLRYAGPYPLVGALFSLYHRHTPRLHPRFFSVMGISFSEKIFHYAWFLQIAMSNGWNSAYAVGAGWCFSLLYEFVPFLGKLDVPDRVADFLGGLASRFLDPPPRILAPHSSNIGGRGGGGSSGRQHRAHSRGQAASAAAGATATGGLRPTAAAQRQPTVVTPDPGAIEQLTNMGFPRNQAVEALQNSNNDVHRAAERLLIQQGAQ